MKIPLRFIFLALLHPPMFAGELLITRDELPDVIVKKVDFTRTYRSGFYPAHAPPGRYTPQQLSVALAGLAPNQEATLRSNTRRRLVENSIQSTRSVIDPNGALQGLDFNGNPLDLETWSAKTGGEANVAVSRQASRLHTVADFTESEFVIKPRAAGSLANINVSLWSMEKPTDIVANKEINLLHSPTTAPAFIPPQALADALARGQPGAKVPLAEADCLLNLGIQEGATTETVEAYNAAYGIDYIGDPDDYLTWIAIGSSSVMVNVRQETEMGRTFLGQKIHHWLVIPDATGEVILNPELTVRVEITDSIHTWDKFYYAAATSPSEVDPADDAILAPKLKPGAVGMVLHELVETSGKITTLAEKSFDSHGAVAGVDYAGNASKPAEWTALTSNDVVVDLLDTRTLTTDAATAHRVYYRYRETSTSPSETGILRIIENEVVGRERVRVVHHCINQRLDPENLPEGITRADVDRALAWARPGEQVIVGEVRQRSLVSETSAPLADFIDTNQWQRGVDFTGDANDPSTWTAAGPADIYIDRYHPILRTRNYDEVTIQYHLTAGNTGNGPRSTQLEISPGNELTLSWKAPTGMEFDVETSKDLKSFQPVETMIKSEGDVLRYLYYSQPSEPSFFLRVRRR